MSTVVQVVVVVVMMTMIMIRVFGCSIEESGFVRVVCIVLQHCKRRIVIEDPFRKASEFVRAAALRGCPQAIERIKEGGAEAQEGTRLEERKI